ncbi:hypothetical protein GOP47_0024481 [Adiantum capillus-veneris]|uniref:Tyrosinase copper-binding domain-containing protein n=1 Tax=Adiantum capillus-veneris TaxID=13818 RepID=A0A9D4U4J8_ADICA|nr:hypothetical protein GOP47_0024481 [Adiantum capillus-veneris]
MATSGSRGSLLLQAAQLIPFVSFFFTLLLFAAPTVSAAPIRVPDLRECELAVDASVTGPPMTLTLNCCLPIPPQSPINFSFSQYNSEPRVRQAAHKVSEDYIAKYTRAYELMKALPDDDPRSFYTQADIHCAFCNFAYMQAGNSSVALQVHFSWLFLPWHRWYLYWHERILQSLLGDPTFSLVFWNWDDQRDGGNVMPDMFVRNGTALYDENRNQNNLPPAVVRLRPNSTGNDTAIVNQNLNDMYLDVVTAITAELFMGGAYRTGTDLTNSTVLDAPLGGLLENGVHNGVHVWTGDPNLPLIQDMGTFTTAARDPIFFAHHSNVDRLWDKWKYDMPDGPRTDHNDSDFLDAEFYFYDETATLVKVTVRDSLDNSKLGVSYPTMDTDELWINYNPPVMSNGSAVNAARAAGIATMGAAPQNGTIFLGSSFSAIVETPSSPQPDTSKATVLVIQGLELTRNSFVSMSGFINLPFATALTDTSSAEYLGTFNFIPTTNINFRHLTANFKFDIADNMQRIGIENETEVLITLVITGVEPVSIQGLLIEYE